MGTMKGSHLQQEIKEGKGFLTFIESLIILKWDWI